MIPTVEECFEIMDKYRMLENIKDHSVMVARVAGMITRKMQDVGRNDLSLDLAVAAALLHDIAKTACLDSNENHAAQGREICLEHDFFEVADIVGEHVVLSNGVPQECCSEKEIVYYADKRVLHDRIVSIEDRLEYILDRYGQNDARLHHLIEQNFRICRTIEQRIFDVLELPPDGLTDMVNGHPLVLEHFNL